MGFFERNDEANGFVGSIRLITDCLTTIKFSFIVNGGVVGRVLVPHRGLRQGCHISPYLFLLCGRAFQPLFRKRRRLRGILVARDAPCISHLFFADNLILFGHASSRDCEAMKDIKAHYAKASGQVINFSKSLIFCLALKLILGGEWRFKIPWGCREITNPMIIT